MRTVGAALTLLAVVALVPGCQPAGEQPQRGRAPMAEDPATAPDDSGAQDPIVVDTPQDGEELTSPAVISGTADVFEATVQYRIVSEGGKVLAKGFTTASCGSGCRGKYSVTVPFKVDEATQATVELFEESAENGKRLHEVTLDVTLLP